MGSPLIKASAIVPGPACQNPKPFSPKSCFSDFAYSKMHERGIERTNILESLLRQHYLRGTQ